MTQNIRQAVFNSLISAEINGRFINLEADAFLKRNQLSNQDRAFYTSLLYGVTEKRITLNYQIGALTAKPASKLQNKVRILLELGLFQLLFMSSVPAHAAVNETVNIAKKTVNPAAVGFINGVLRQASDKLISDGSINLILPDKDKDISSYLSVLYSFPRYMCRLWLKSYGDKKTEEIMLGLNRNAELSVRVNTLKINREEYLKLLKSSSVNALPSKLCDDGILIQSGSVRELVGYEDGLFFIQDDASRLAVSALAPKPGDRLLDCCACPGGKSFAAALSMKGQGEIISCDIHENKLPLITAGAERLGINIIRTVCSDASVFRPEFELAFDKVLCDVPCSGFGTIAKKPDLRFKNRESIESLPELQYRILLNCSRYVRHGGFLMYSTCTLNPAENEQNCEKFLSEFAEFTLSDIKTVFPSSKNDGFFFAIFKRI